MQNHLSFVRKLVLTELETLVVFAVFQVHKIANRNRNIEYFLPEFLKKHLFYFYSDDPFNSLTGGEKNYLCYVNNIQYDVKVKEQTYFKQKNKH